VPFVVVVIGVTAFTRQCKTVAVQELQRKLELGSAEALCASASVPASV
jgi:hypothetical protein